jgi:DnaD/phage-associated family protein
MNRARRMLDQVRRCLSAMKRAWIKLYVELLDDRKLGPLPVALRWRFVQLLLVAAEYDRDGLLPPPGQMAWRLRVRQADLLKSLVSLGGCGVLSRVGKGWKVTNFATRQASLTDAERSAQYRNRRRIKDVTNRVTTRDAVAVADSSSTSTSTSASASASQGEGVQGEGAVFTAFERNIGALVPFIADGLKADIDDYSAAWVIAAIERAARAEKRNLGYVEAILRGWRRDGLSSPPPPRLSRRERDQPVQLSPEEEARLTEEFARDLEGKS